MLYDGALATIDIRPPNLHAEHGLLGVGQIACAPRETTFAANDRRENNLTDFAFRTFAQSVLVLLQLLEFACRFTQFQDFLLELRDVTISRFQFRCAGSQRSFEIARLKMSRSKSGLSAGKQGSRMRFCRLSPQTNCAVGFQIPRDRTRSPVKNRGGGNASTNMGAPFKSPRPCRRRNRTAIALRSISASERTSVTDPSLDDR